MCRMREHMTGLAAWEILLLLLLVLLPLPDATPPAAAAHPAHLAGTR